MKSRILVQFSWETFTNCTRATETCKYPQMCNPPPPPPPHAAPFRTLRSASDTPSVGGGRVRGLKLVGWGVGGGGGRG